MSEEKERLEADAKIEAPFLKKLENFWYHYKWQFLAGLLALVVLAVSLSQCVKNGKGDDAYVMYAGGYTFTSATAMRDLEQSLASFAEDRNGDGRAVVGIGTYSIYTNEEINEKYKDPSDRAQVKQFSHDNRESFDQEILAGEATLCFLSQSLFSELAEEGLLLALSEYHTPTAGEEVVSCGGAAYGVRLSSLPLATYPGLSSLPVDTVLCVRANASMNSIFGGKTAEAMYKANLEMAKRMLSAAPFAAE